MSYWRGSDSFPRSGSLSLIMMIDLSSVRNLLSNSEDVLSVISN